ncbi:MAG TPA: alpha/beta fold hydrolase [Ignavibacteria bacterium]|nr:alpha/beta fold hydrolase [Ignavibacteria bacterium]
MQEKFVNNNGVDIQYLVVNYSPGETPLVIIPGAIVGAEDFYNDIKDFIDFYCVIISIRGRGKSGSPLTGYTKDDQVSDIEAVIQAEIVDKLYILGHSFGVSLAVSYSIKHCEKIKGLIMADFPPIYPAYTEEWAQYIRKNFEGINENFLNGIVKDGTYEDLSGKLGKLDFKKLILKGIGSDSLLKQESLEKICNKLTNVSYKVINGCGHEMFGENPMETLKEVKDFMK